MINEVLIVGNIGSDPDIRTMANGSRMASFSVATTRKYKNKDGEWVEATDWIRVATFIQGFVSLVEKYAQKGTLVLVSGRLNTRSWVDKDGNKRSSTEVVVDGGRGLIRTLARARNSDVGNGEGEHQETHGGTNPMESDDIPF